MTDPHFAHERTIRPRHAWLGLDWRRLLQYRDLLFIMVRRDFVARYQQTILGPAWFILQPLVATGALTLIFSRGLGTSTDGVAPAFLFYQCGMLVWSYFSVVLGGAGNTFQANASVFTKVYFPRLIVPLAVAVGSFAPLAVQSIVFLLLYGPVLIGGPAWRPDFAVLALLPIGLLQAAAFALGLSLLTSALSAKYRDLQHALPFLLQLGFFVTPVVYPLSQLSAGARWVAALNPLTAITEAFRVGFFGVGTLNARLCLVSAAGTLVVLVAGLMLFQRAERTFADTV